MRRGLLATGVGVVLGVATFIPTQRVVAPLFVPPAPAPVRVVFGGDIMLDRNVARTAESEGAAVLFASIAEVFVDADIRIANLEGTITENPSIARRDNTILRFTFDPVIAEQALAPLRLNAVSLANNHALDFGEFGYDETRERLLRDMGVQSFGNPYNDTGRLSMLIEVDEKRLCFIGFHSLYNPSTVSVVEEIQALRPTCWRLVVLPHWGEEYEHVAGQEARAAAHEFIDAGADLVVGAHPHVVQDHEVYKGKAIFYSLGNFMFDQNFSWGTTHGMLLRADFSDTQTRFMLIPTVIKDQKASLATGEDRQKVLELAGVPAAEAQVAEFILP